MDNSPFIDDHADASALSLSYDDTVAYEDQVGDSDRKPRLLANRIGNTKVYLLSESSVPRVGKRKHEDEAIDVDEDIEENEDLSSRGNALLFQGQPISHLPTARLFAYATHFDAHPMGLEWIDDFTAVFVFDSKFAARTAWKYLRKSAAEEQNEDGFVTARPIPIAFWPPEERINKSLGMGEGLKGTIKMRWAKIDDVKKKGAKKDSQFYRKHGVTAGKDLRGDESVKRRRRDTEGDAIQTKEQLDDELDAFLADEEEVVEPPSKMRSDYIGNDGRTLLERTSAMRVHPVSLESRITAPLPRRRGGRARLERNGTHADDMLVDGNSRKGGNDGRPMRSQKELDDELDAFLNARD